MKALKLVFLFILSLAIVGGAASLLNGCGRSSSATVGSEEAHKTIYTCGMHPQVVQPTPGNCPICGMKLTPIRKQAETAKGSPANM